MCILSQHVLRTFRFRVPDGCDLVAAGALPVVYGTSHVALLHRAHLTSGQVLLVFPPAVLQYIWLLILPT